jgi:hypothetical protein
MFNARAFLFLASVGLVTVAACTGSSTGGLLDCSTRSPCKADAPSSQADIDSCNASRNDPVCGAKYTEYVQCGYSFIKCGADNKEDVAATRSAAHAGCPQQLAAYEACKAGGGADGGASSSSSGSGSGGTSSGGLGLPGLDAGGGSSSSSSGSSGAGGCGTITWKSQTCSSCMDSKCCAQARACTDDAACASLLSCLLDCGTSTTCPNDCATANPGGVQAYNALGTCFQNSCATQCN